MSVGVFTATNSTVLSLRNGLEYRGYATREP